MLIGNENKENEFLGRKIIGEVSHYGERSVEQHNPRKFLATLLEVMYNANVEAVRWEQYTPYFNDGEACVFYPTEPRFKIAGMEKEGDWYDNYLSTYEIEDEDLKEQLEKFSTVLESGHHYSILNEKFGDPAQVT